MLRATIGFKGNNMENNVAIKDISIASYLMCSDQVRLVKSERKGNKFVIFYFSPKSVVEQLVSDYWSDSASVSPRELMSNLRSLKDLIFSGK